MRLRTNKPSQLARGLLIRRFSSNVAKALQIGVHGTNATKVLEESVAQPDGITAKELERFFSLFAKVD